MVSATLARRGFWHNDCMSIYMPERMTPKSRVRARASLAAALAEIRGRTQTLSRARFAKLVSEAVAYARKRR